MYNISPESKELSNISEVQKWNRVKNKEEVFLFALVDAIFFIFSQSLFGTSLRTLNFGFVFYCHDLLSWPVFRHFYLPLWVSGWRKKNCTSVNHNFGFSFFRDFPRPWKNIIEKRVAIVYGEKLFVITAGEFIARILLVGN